VPLARKHCISVGAFPKFHPIEKKPSAKCGLKHEAPGFKPGAHEIIKSED